jgi:NDP-sugar pyrophosphorylase family protein
MTNVVIPMAGLGSRFPRDKYYLPKPLIDVNGKPMIQRAIESLDIDGQYHFILRNDEFLNITKDVINKIVDEPVFVTVDQTTEGPACSVLLLKDYINNSDELITANCDQIMDWSSKLFFHNVRLYDGAVVTYYSDTDKNSYVKLDRSGRAVQFAEKEVISNISLNGIHYWKQGSYFVRSAEELIAANDRAPNGEFYISMSYNYMIAAGLECGIFHIPNECHHAVGVPIDLERFLKYDKA